MRGDYLDVLHGAAAISVLVFEPRIGQLDVPVLVRQLMLLRPSSDGIGRTTGSLSPLTVRTILGLKKPLILPLQLLFENHAPDALSELDVALGGLHVRGVNT
jgi:hypothetical protein